MDQRINSDTATLEDSGKTVRQLLAEVTGSSAFFQLQSLYRQKSLWQILGISRDENRHTKFLTWLLNPNSSHGLGMLPLKKLLRLVATSASTLPCNAVVVNGADGERWFSDDFLDAVTADLVVFSDIVVRDQTSHSKKLGERDYEREGSKPEKAIRYFDIEIKGKIAILEKEPVPLRIVIENKVLSEENRPTEDSPLWQTQDYEQIIGEERSENKKEETILLFLSLDAIQSVGAERTCKSERFFQINYQMILDEVLTPALKSVLDEQSQFMLCDYIRALAVPAAEENPKRQDNREVVMAISNTEKKLLNDFWNNNEQFFNTMLEARAQDPNLTPEDREKYAKLQNRSKSSERDYGRFTLSHLGEVVDSGLNKRALVKTLINDFCHRFSQKPFDSLKELFPERLRSRVVVTGDTPRDLSRYFNYNSSGKKYLPDYQEIPEMFGGEVFYVSNQWGGDGMNELVDYINGNQNGFGYQIKREI